MRRTVAAAQALAAVALSGAVLARCVPASPDADTYDDSAAQTVGSAISDVRTVQRLLETLSDDRMLRPVAVAELRYSEERLGKVTQAFTELNPPPQRDRLAQQLSTLLEDGGDLLAESRVAVHRHETGEYSSLATDLERLAADMEELEGRVQ